MNKSRLSSEMPFCVIYPYIWLAQSLNVLCEAYIMKHLTFNIVYFNISRETEETDPIPQLKTSYICAENYVREESLNDLTISGWTRAADQ